MQFFKQFSILTSSHFDARSRQRGQPDDVVGFVLTFGHETRSRGASHFTVRLRDLPPELRRSPIAQRAVGVIVVAEGPRLETVYRRPDATKFIRRKAKGRHSRRGRNRRGQ